MPFIKSEDETRPYDEGAFRTLTQIQDAMQTIADVIQNSHYAGSRVKTVSISQDDRGGLRARVVRETHLYLKP